MKESHKQFIDKFNGNRVPSKFKSIVWVGGQPYGIVHARDPHIRVYAIGYNSYFARIRIRSSVNNDCLTESYFDCYPRGVKHPVKGIFRTIKLIIEQERDVAVKPNPALPTLEHEDSDEEFLETLGVFL